MSPFWISSFHAIFKCTRRPCRRPPFNRGPVWFELFFAAYEYIMVCKPATIATVAAAAEDNREVKALPVKISSPGKIRLRHLLNDHLRLPRRPLDTLPVLLRKIRVSGHSTGQVSRFPCNFQRIHPADGRRHRRGIGGGMLHEILHGNFSEAFGSGPDTMLCVGLEPFTRYGKSLDFKIVSQIDVAHNEIWISCITRAFSLCLPILRFLAYSRKNGSVKPPTVSFF